MSKETKEGLIVLSFFILALGFVFGAFALLFHFNDIKLKEIENEKYKNATGKIIVAIRYREEYPINTDSIQYIDNNCIKVLDTQISSYRVFCGNFQIEYFNK